jgi:hypothetical protein
MAEKRCTSDLPQQIGCCQIVRHTSFGISTSPVFLDAVIEYIADDPTRRSERRAQRELHHDLGIGA